MAQTEKLMFRSTEPDADLMIEWSKCTDFRNKNLCFFVIFTWKYDKNAIFARVRDIQKNRKKRDENNHLATCRKFQGGLKILNVHAP